MNAFMDAIEHEYQSRVKGRGDYIALPIANKRFTPYAFGPTVEYFWVVGTPEQIDDLRGIPCGRPIKKTRIIYGGDDYQRNPFVFKDEFDAIIFAEVLNTASQSVLKRMKRENP